MCYEKKNPAVAYAQDCPSMEEFPSTEPLHDGDGAASTDDPTTKRKGKSGGFQSMGLSA